MNRVLTQKKKTKEEINRLKIEVNLAPPKSACQKNSVPTNSLFKNVIVTSKNVLFRLK
jgi:hypothetical protein